MSDAVNNNSAESGETIKVEPSADPATTTPADTAAAAVTEVKVESAENTTLSENTSQPAAAADSEQENKQAEESMEVEESKPAVETLESKETSQDTSINPSSASHESNDNESAMASAETKPVVTTGADSSVTTTVSNESKKSEPAKDKRLKVDLSKAPVRQYLDATVVPVLLGALSAVARERPTNPVEYLGNYLIEKSKEVSTE